MQCKVSTFPGTGPSTFPNFSVCKLPPESRSLPPMHTSLLTQSLKLLPLKPGVGQWIAVHATRTARDFFLTYFYPSSSFACIFFQNFPRFFLCWLWLTHGSCVGLQNKKKRSPCQRQVPELSARGI